MKSFSKSRFSHTAKNFLQFISLKLLIMSILTQLYGQKSFVVVERHALADIYAASGIAETPEGWLVVCDDVPDMFLMDRDGNLQSQYVISAPPPVLVEGRVPKKHKRDFEA